MNFTQHFEGLPITPYTRKNIFPKNLKKSKKKCTSVAMTFKRSNSKGLSRNTLKNKSVVLAKKVLRNH